MAAKKEEMRIKIIKDGPYRVTGGLPLYEQVIVTDEAGHTRELIDKKEYPQQETYILCRTEGRQEKENAIRKRFSSRMEDALKRLAKTIAAG